MNIQNKKALSEKERCGTMMLLDEIMSQNKDIKNRYMQSIKDAEKRKTSPETNTPSDNQRTTSVMTIPLVFHIVLNNPYIVTDADIQAQIDRLNLDFSGLNPDSTNAVSFYGVRGHSGIRFCLAKRDPAGRLTNGIERKSSATRYTTQINDPIKTSAQGGLDAWNPTNYLNVWIGEGDGLGYSTFPGTITSSQDGIVLNISGTSNNPCYVNNSYNLGRTATHEIGHYLGIYHIWGDSPIGCTTDDFRQLPGSCTVPASLLIGDTPNQSSSTLGCPTGQRTDACSPVAPGFMYQNYMDYTNDACMTMFSKAQVSRMEWVLANCRPGLLTSNGCSLPASPTALDATVASIINPGGSEVAGCTVIQQAPINCAGLFTPKLIIQNRGLATLTSVKVGLQVNAASPVIQTFSVNIPSGGYTTITLSQQFLNAGTNSLRFFTAEPNGGTDEVPSNDQMIINVTVASPINIPISEGFESEIFPPANWFLFNPNNNNTWQHFLFPGNGTSGAAYFDNYNNNTLNQIDDLRSTGLSYSGPEDVKVSFDLAYKNSLNSSEQDTLAVLISTDCGNSFTTLYKKWGSGLATAGPSSTPYLNPIASDWKNESIIVPNALISGNQFLIAFRNINRYGNNIFLDNINIAPVFERDIQVLSINNPSDILCTNSTTPSITVKNAGTRTITGFNVHYKIDNNPVVTSNFTGVSIPQNGTLNLALSNASGLGLGAHNIRVYTSALVTSNGSGDQNLLNDTLAKSFSITGTATAPLVEGFENAGFPPVGWGISNPDNGITWKKHSSGFNSNGSAFVNTFNYKSFGQKDQLFTPVINYTTADSVLLNFDLSAATYSDPRSTSIPLDTLEILVTKDCGNTFTSVYKKWGVALQTINDPINGQENEFFPSNSSQWRAEKIDLTLVANNAPIQVVFRITNNFENNIFIDNVNLKTVLLPERLKKNGYLVLPSPFQNQFSVWFRSTPFNLSYINVFNAAGQMVWTKRYNANAGNFINIDLTGKQAGIYFVHFGYSNQKNTVVEKVVKY